MFRRFTCARCQYPKLLVYMLLGFGFLFLFKFKLKHENTLDISSVASEAHGDAVQREKFHVNSKPKEGLTFIEKDLKKEEKREEEPLSKTEVYLRDRIAKIKQNCGDVCKTDQDIFFDGRFLVSK